MWTSNIAWTDDVILTSQVQMIENYCSNALNVVNQIFDDCGIMYKKIHVFVYHTNRLDSWIGNYNVICKTFYNQQFITIYFYNDGDKTHIATCKIFQFVQHLPLTLDQVTF